MRKVICLTGNRHQPGSISQENMIHLYQIDDLFRLQMLHAHTAAGRKELNSASILHNNKDGKITVIGQLRRKLAIAQDCGFSSVYHFCRCFKQRTGKTPTQYAAENKTYQI